MPNKLIKERSAIYGNYTDHCEFRQSVMRQMNDLHKAHNNGQEIPATVEIMVGDVIGKISRIAATPHHIDSLKDIQGYIQLIINHFEEPE